MILLPLFLYHIIDVSNPPSHGLTPASEVDLAPPSVASLLLRELLCNRSSLWELSTTATDGLRARDKLTEQPEVYRTAEA
jgi:hypothetical protein